VDAARNLGAREIVLMGTEPIRRAADAAILVRDVEARTGLPLHVLAHHEEGILTLAGVTMGRTAGREIMVVDVGGGSSEIVIAAPGTPARTIGLPLGSARLTLDHVRSDPVTMDEIDAMVLEARRVVAEAPDASPEEMIAVGGTASNLLRILPGTVSDGILTSRRVTIALAMLSEETSAATAARHTLRHTRARILPAGAVIVDAILERYGVERLRVSEAGIREGAILVAVVAGHAWRDRLPALAGGWES
jgi:exopolyphosphatase/guanosine-5'-triphosphate,3'-diphosphate pyrophosphatase